MTLISGVVRSPIRGLTSPKGVGGIPRNLTLTSKNLTLGGKNLILRTR